VRGVPKAVAHEDHIAHGKEVIIPLAKALRKARGEARQGKMTMQMKKKRKRESMAGRSRHTSYPEAINTKRHRRHSSPSRRQRPWKNIGTGRGQAAMAAGVQRHLMRRKIDLVARTTSTVTAHWARNAVCVILQAAVRASSVKKRR